MDTAVLTRHTPPATVREILGYELGTTLENVFAAMELAEERIAEYEKRYPLLAPRIHHAFLLLQPGQLTELPTLLAPHYDELLERVIHGDDTREATDAEVILTLYHLSLAAPLTSEYSELYRRLLAKHLPNAPVGEPNPVCEPLLAEYEYKMRRHLRHDWRKP